MARSKQRSLFTRLREAARPFIDELVENLKDYDWRPHFSAPSRSCRPCFEKRGAGPGGPYFYHFEDAGACCHCGEVVKPENSVAVQA